MALSDFPLWLRSRTDALANRCAALIQRHRLNAAIRQLNPQAREKAAFWRARYLARNARLQREREARRGSRTTASELPPAPGISKADVLAAIARSRASREARLKASREDREPR